jgi:hypothetical protein
MAFAKPLARRPYERLFKSCFDCGNAIFREQPQGKFPVYYKVNCAVMAHPEPYFVCSDQKYPSLCWAENCKQFTKGGCVRFTIGTEEHGPLTAQQEHILTIEKTYKLIST